jgi:hypothetical protein
VQPALEPLDPGGLGIDEMQGLDGKASSASFGENGLTRRREDAKR